MKNNPSQPNQPAPSVPSRHQQALRKQFEASGDSIADLAGTFSEAWSSVKAALYQPLPPSARIILRLIDRYGAMYLDAEDVADGAGQQDNQSEKASEMQPKDNQKENKVPAWMKKPPRGIAAKPSKN